MHSISIYKKANDIRSQETIPLDIFVDRIKEGYWQDIVLPLRAMRYGSKEQDEAKKKAPNVTISGTFSERKDGALLEHSGFISIDIDDIDDIDHYKSLLACEPYIYAMFTSIRGKGICCLFKIDGKKHREAFAGICEYLYEKYQVICDPTSVNQSRARFVSFDPETYVNHKPRLFNKYPKVKQFKAPKVIFVKNDFDRIIQQICDRRVNLCETYEEWLRIGFALADHFGEGGREYYHTLSAISGKYKSGDTDRQFTNCLKARGSRRATIASLYYMAKQAGIETYSKEVKEIATIAQQGKRAGLSNEQIKTNIAKFSSTEHEEIDTIIEQVEAGATTPQGKEDENVIPALETFLRTSYTFKRNTITRYIELNGEQMERKHFNSVFIKAKRVIPKVSSELVEKLIDSEFTPEYNPIQDYFTSNELPPENETIEHLFLSINGQEPEITYHFGKKWLVGIVASAFGHHSPLMLCLAGKKQNTGKTEFFRRLFPPPLKKYYAESKLDAGKDDDILMTQKLLIMDDEMGGKSKQDERRLKELLSKDVFSLREPYGKGNVDLKRLAVLCGTSNEKRLISDATGNRRLLPIYVDSIDHAMYNKIDKHTLLMTAYGLFINGFDYRLSKSDIEILNDNTEDFQSYSVEYELITRFFQPAYEEPCNLFTATDVKVWLEEKTKQKLTTDRIGKELKRLGYEQRIKKSGGHSRRCYMMHFIGNEPMKNEF